MRRVTLAFLASAIMATTLAESAASAQTGAPSTQRNPNQRPRPEVDPGDEVNLQELLRGQGQAPIGSQNAGPCPYVKILYDAARYVELAGDRVSASAVGYTGEIQGLTADCRYREDDPIEIDINILFQLGRGPQAAGDNRTYRYWIAVTERNSAILAKEYFDFPVDFAGQDRVSVTEEIRGLRIPRAHQAVSGDNFEVLIGFDVTPEMADFNRSGSRFRINAGQTPAGTSGGQ